MSFLSRLFPGIWASLDWECHMWG